MNVSRRNNESVSRIGVTNFRRDRRPFGIRERDRGSHAYVVGKTGTGKSTLLLNMAVADIAAGHGVGVIDPHGDLAEAVLDRVPENRIDAVKGVFRANHTKSLGAGKKWVRKPEDEWVIREVEAVVSADLWDQCQAIRAEQEKAGRRQTKKVVHLFAGYAFCHCGAKMNVPSNSPKYICGKCRNKIPVLDLEEVFRSQLTGFFSSPTEVATYLERADETIKEKEAQLASLLSEQKKVTIAKDKVYGAYIADELDVKSFGRQFRPLTARLDEIEAEVPRLQAEIDFLKINLRSSDVVLEEARDLYFHWPALEPQQKRLLIENITQRIVVGHDDIAIDLCYLPPVPKNVAEGQRNFTSALPRAA